jgi:hypothetical protein
MKSLITNLVMLLTLIIVAPIFAQTPVSTSTNTSKVFLSNDGGANNDTMQRAYQSVVSALQTKDNLTVVKTPTEANIFISLKCDSKSRVQDGITVYDHTVKLAVTDPSTHQILWSVEERGPYPAFHMGGDAWGKNFAAVAEKLAADLQQAETNGSVNLHPH